MDLQNRTAIITGGGKRVGRGITLALAEAGANVVMTYRQSGEEAKNTLAEVEALGVSAMIIQCDVTDLASVRAMVAAAAARFETIDVLVNNASVFVPDHLPVKDYAGWHNAIDTLVHGSFYCSNEVAPLMLAQKRGVIIGIADLSALEPWPGFAGHAVGKGAILTLTRQLALELAPHVRANALIPGPALRPRSYDDAKYERVAHSTLLERWGTATEMGQAVRFLCEAEYVTGEFLTVDGGQRFGHRRHEHG
ncbi:MAG: SDR family oxidoreductase [Actinobacteria bacterium]|nr:SDR family oxidoreductase [Actinomycetota bacterium]